MFAGYNLNYIYSSKHYPKKKKKENMNMKEVWSETSIRAEIAKFDKRTGLKGAELPISLIM